MANSDGKITAPVRVTDVKTALGVSSNDVGYLCNNQHGRINMWAKYKPVRFPKINAKTEPNWWKAYSLNCGIYIKMISDIAEIDSLTWTYESPRGGANEPFRLGDFDGYNHNGLGSYIYPFVRQANLSYNMASWTYDRYQIVYRLPSSSDMLSIDDISVVRYGSGGTVQETKPLKNMYGACEIRHSTGKKIFFFSETKISEGKPWIDVSFNLLRDFVGSNFMRFFLVDTKLPNGANETDVNRLEFKYPMFKESGYYNTVSLFLTKESILSVAAYQISNQISGNYATVIQHNRLDNPFIVNQDGTCYIILQVINKETYDMTILQGNLTVSTKSFQGEEIIGLGTNRMYDQYNNLINQIRVPAKNTSIIKLLWNYNSAGSITRNITILANMRVQIKIGEFYYDSSSIGFDWYVKS